MSLFVRGATLDDAPVGLRIEAGTIVALDAMTAAPGDEIVDATGLAIVPGLVNGHGHAAMTLLRGYGDDLPLMPWLEQKIWPAEARMSADDVYWGTRLACLEMIRSGTTRCWDMYWHSDAVARAVADSGMRATVSQVLLGSDTAPVSARPEAAADGLDRIAELGPLVQASLGPHAIYTVDEAALRYVAELSAARDVPVQMHLSETEQEVADCVAAHGCRPAEYLDRVGLLTERTVLAHGVWLDDAELARIAERTSTVVTNPASNMKLAVGRTFPYPAARRAGVAMGIGTDGVASNNSLDLFDEMKCFALAQKLACDDAAAVSTVEVFELAAGRRAPALGATPVAVGAPADFSLVDPSAPELVPAPLVDGLVYSGASAAVRTVVIDGGVVMRDRRIEGTDEVVEQVWAAARRIRDDEE